MYRKTPVPKNTAAKISAILTLIGGAFMFIMVSGDNIPLPWLAQTIGIVFLTFSVYVAVAFLLRRYTFILETVSKEDGENDCDFIVKELKSNREIKVCHVSVHDIAFIREVNAANKSPVAKERQKKKKYTYDTQVCAARRLEIAIEYDGEDISLLVTYDEELLNALVAAGVRKI